MTLSRPKYLTSSDAAPVDYAWDDRAVESAEGPIDQALLALLERVSYRAAVAFLCGTAEWILHRLAPLCDIAAARTAADFLESAWARQVDLRYGDERWEEVAEDWSGAVGGALKRTLDRVEVALEEVINEGTPPARDAAATARLAGHVLGDPALYTHWQQAVIARLAKLYPFDPTDPLGDVVPREALDPDEAFGHETTEQLVDALLRQLDHHANRFLNAPEEMQRQGFDGSPYQFDLEEDRVRRRSGKNKAPLDIVIETPSGPSTWSAQRAAGDAHQSLEEGRWLDAAEYARMAAGHPVSRPRGLFLLATALFKAGDRASGAQVLRALLDAWLDDGLVVPPNVHPRHALAREDMIALLESAGDPFGDEVARVRTAGKLPEPEGDFL